MVAPAGTENTQSMTASSKRQSGNQLTGTLPDSFVNLTELRWLSISNNYLDADAAGDALIPATLATWFSGLDGSDIGGQELAPYLLPRKSWRYKVYLDNR